MINYTNSNIETYGSGAYSGKLIVKAHTTTPNAAITCLNGNVGGDNPVFINFVNEFVANQYNYLAPKWLIWIVCHKRTNCVALGGEGIYTCNIDTYM